MRLNNWSQQQEVGFREEDKAAKRLPGMVNSPYPDLPRWDR